MWKQKRNTEWALGVLSDGMFWGFEWSNEQFARHLCVFLPLQIAQSSCMVINNRERPLPNSDSSKERRRTSSCQLGKLTSSTSLKPDMMKEFRMLNHIYLRERKPHVEIFRCLPSDPTYTFKHIIHTLKARDKLADFGFIGLDLLTCARLWELC